MCVYVCVHVGGLHVCVFMWMWGGVRVCVCVCVCICVKCIFKKLKKCHSSKQNTVELAMVHTYNPSTKDSKVEAAPPCSLG